MANFNPQKTYMGDDLMVFYNDKSWAWATSHSLSISAETTEVNTKDNGPFSSADVSKITHEITTENLYCEDFDTLFNLMIQGQPITLKFGLKKDEGDDYVADGDIENWIPTDEVGKKYYEASYLLTSLDLNASTGEKSTYSATFTGIGAIRQKTVAQA